MASNGNLCAQFLMYVVHKRRKHVMYHQLSGFIQTFDGFLLPTEGRYKPPSLAFSMVYKLILAYPLQSDSRKTYNWRPRQKVERIQEPLSPIHEHSQLGMICPWWTFGTAWSWQKQLPVSAFGV